MTRFRIGFAKDETGLHNCTKSQKIQTKAPGRIEMLSVLTGQEKV